MNSILLIFKCFSSLSLSLCRKRVHRWHTVRPCERGVNVSSGQVVKWASERNGAERERKSNDVSSLCLPLLSLGGGRPCVTRILMLMLLQLLGERIDDHRDHETWTAAAEFSLVMQQQRCSKRSSHCSLRSRWTSGRTRRQSEKWGSRRWWWCRNVAQCLCLAGRERLNSWCSITRHLSDHCDSICWLSSASVWMGEGDDGEESSLLPVFLFSSNTIRSFHDKKEPRLTK
jgi:hypothetical protein